NGELVTDATHVNGTLAKIEGNPRVAGGGILNGTFHDDGVAPGGKAHHGTLTASGPVPQDAIRTFVGGKALDPTLTPGDTNLFATFGFVYTGHPPAHFTGRFRETIEDGSLALYAGIEFEEEQGYVFRARLYDADGNPLLLMTADGVFGPDTHEIRFLAF